MDYPFGETNEERKHWIEEQEKEFGDFVVALGGTETGKLVREARRCYENGFFIATTMLGASIIEHELVFMLIEYTEEQDYLQNLSQDDPHYSLGIAAGMSKKHNLIDDDLESDIENVKQIRDAYVHYRNPTYRDAPTSREFRSWSQSMKDADKPTQDSMPERVPLSKDGSKTAIKVICKLNQIIVEREFE